MVDVIASHTLRGCPCSGNCDDFANVHSTIHVLFRGPARTGKTDTAGNLLTNSSSNGNSSARGAADEEQDDEWLVIDPRLVALGTTPLAGLVDMWYGTSSVSANLFCNDSQCCFIGAFLSETGAPRRVACCTADGESKSRRHDQLFLPQYQAAVRARERWMAALGCATSIGRCAARSA